MVKVIGKDQEMVKRATCRHCASILEYVQNDTKSYSGTDYGGGPDGCIWIVCPNCSNKVILKSW